MRNDLVHRTKLLRLRSAQFLTAEQEVTTANLADDFRPDDMQTVPWNDAECGMRRILKVGVFGGDDDVAEQGIFGMHRHRPIDRCDHRDLYVEDILEDLGALAEDLVVSGGREEVETIRADLGTEFVARACQDYDVVLGIIADVTEGLDQRFMHVAVEHERPASRMQRHLEDSILSLHPHVFVFVAVAFEHSLTRSADILRDPTRGEDQASSGVESMPVDLQMFDFPVERRAEERRASLPRHSDQLLCLCSRRARLR